MTVLDVPLVAHHLPASIRSVRRILPMAGCALPAAPLQNPVVAEWVRRHKVAVMVCGDDELDLVRAVGVRPVHVVLRCCPMTQTIRRAAALGVVRYVVSTDRHIDALTGCAAPAKHVYLADQGPAALSERLRDVVGMHGDVDDSRGVHEWGAAAERLLGRMALMRERRLTLTRISLTGGSAATWLAGGGHELTAIATAIDEALDEGCARWRLPRPAVALAPSAP
jgi:diaminopimelate decarboxylase